MWRLLGGVAMLAGGIYGFIHDAAQEYVARERMAYRDNMLRRHAYYVMDQSRRGFGQDLIRKTLYRTDRYQRERLEAIERSPITSWLSSLF